MNSRAWMLVRAVRGPIILITLGTLFALDQSGELSFRRTWPILLILFGVLKLAERVLAPPPPPFQPPVPPPGTPGAWPQGGYQS